MRKEDIFKTVKDVAGQKGVTAQEISDILGLNRANVSRELNRLTEENLLKKISGRPVRYVIRNEAKSEYLDTFVKQHPSLERPFDHGKAAVLYPPNGMHLLILGETGVGKSMFAKQLYDYAVDSGKLESDAPFITFNCADYAYNPQLLLGHLFGVKKGAYTGAASQEGLVSKANGGVLFLDEIHRLPPEGQEMLFTFIDQSVYRRLGESDTIQCAKVLIMGATTETPSSSMLGTFLRRIPMVITIPPLRERSLQERYYLITSFLKEEARRIGQEIKVSANTIRSFLFYPCRHNIGQLKVDIQLACAKAYVEVVSGKQEIIQLHSSDLSDEVKEGLFLYRRQKDSFNIPYPYLFFHPSQDRESEPYAFSDETVYERIERKFKDLKSKGISDEEKSLLLEMDVESFFTQSVNHMETSGQTELHTLLPPEIMNLAQDILLLATERLERLLNEKIVYALALHLKSSIARQQEGKSIQHPDLNAVRRSYPNEFLAALDAIKLIEDRYQLQVPLDEAGFLAAFFSLEYKEEVRGKDRVAVLVIMHGNGVASGMAETVQTLLGTDPVRAIDMPLTSSPSKIYEQTRNLVKMIASEKGVLLLVDMGSLVSFEKMLNSDLRIPVRVIPMASTPHVLEAARKAMTGTSLEDLYQDIRHLTYGGTETELVWNGGKFVILTVCQTGEGSSRAVAALLEKHLKLEKDQVHILSIPYESEQAFNTRVSKMTQNMKVLCIVSDFYVGEEYPHFSLFDVVRLTALPKIQQLLDTEITYAKMGDTLSYHLNHVNDKYLIPQIKRMLAWLQEKLSIDLPTHDLVGIVLHLCCMVDRLAGNEPLVPFLDKENYIKQHKELYGIIRIGMEILEERNQILIPDDEVCYMIRFILQHTGHVQESV